MIRIRTTAPWRPLLAAVLASLVVAGCGGAQARYASHMERGKQYLTEGNLDKAGVEFRNALQIQPKAADALYYNGRVAERRGDIRAAMGNYQAAVDVQADHVEARANLGRVLVFGGAPDRALAIIAPVLEKHPDDARLLTVRGAARGQLKDAAGARKDAERAVQLDPKDENAVALLAALERQAGDNDSAVALLQKTVAAAPDSIDLRQVLASLYIAQDRFDAAEEQLRKIVELRPKDLTQRYQLALFYARAKRFDAAQSALEDAVKAQPESDEAKLALADFISSQRSRAQGEKILRDFLAQNPDNHALRLGLGALLQRTGATKEAIDAFNEVVRRDGTGPQGLTARSRIAALEIAAGHAAEAQRLIDEVLRKNPRDSEALLLRGNLALDRHDAGAAIADLRAVLRDEPGSVPIRRTLARAYLANGDVTLAEEALRGAMDVAPTDTMVRVELAQVYAQTQRLEQAATLLEQTVRAAPNAPEPREALVRVYLAEHDLAAARTAAEDLKTLRPDSASGFYLAGLAAREDKRDEDSRKNLEHALELQPMAIDALTALVTLDLAQGHGAQAVARVHAVVDRDPKNALAQNLLGEMYLTTHDLAHADDVLVRTIELAPRWWVPYRNRALCKLAAKDTDGAIKVYEAGVKASQDPSQLAVELAALYEQQGRIDAAIAQYEDLRKHNLHMQLAANNLAMLLVNYKKDQASLDRARDLTAEFAQSDSGALLDTHGWVRFRRGEYQQALPILERAVQKAPDARVIRYHLGMAELRAGNREQARHNLETALSGGTATFTGSDEARTTLDSLKNSG